MENLEIMFESKEEAKFVAYAEEITGKKKAMDAVWKSYKKWVVLSDKEVKKDTCIGEIILAWAIVCLMKCAIRLHTASYIQCLSHLWDTWGCTMRHEAHFMRTLHFPYFPFGGVLHQDITDDAIVTQLKLEADIHMQAFAFAAANFPQAAQMYRCILANDS